jgi:hypothetical protein
MSANQWLEELSERMVEAELAKIRLNTHTGRPLGNDSFISKLERFLGRRVRALPIGRPTKNKKEINMENNNR